MERMFWTQGTASTTARKRIPGAESILASLKNGEVTVAEGRVEGGDF